MRKISRALHVQFNKLPFRSWLFAVIFAFPLCIFSAAGVAGTVVEVQTSLGVFFIEVDEQAAPVTAGNFLNYVTSGRYNNTFIHGTTGGSLIRGGGYTYDSCTVGPEHIPTDAPIALEETGLSNLDGTIAALHPSGNADGATSEWFINLGNDTGLDTQDGGYAVFGRVLGDGLGVVRSISVANVVRLGFFLETPTTNYFETGVDCQLFSRDNLIMVRMSVLDDNKAAATADFEPLTQSLGVNLDLGAAGFIRIPFAVDLNATQAAIRAQLDAAVDLQQPVPNMASYNAVSGRLHLPSIAVGGEIVYRNVIFDLIDSAAATFELRSYE
ncbi:MAG TPA: hypothetical protein DCX09_01260 [Gammaproteobacteria bacterium]|nr:hypothetical protein [Gammaproteobacteria bacterium]